MSVIHTESGAPPRARPRRVRGAACVEVALVLPLLLYLVLGIVDLGRFAYAYVTITNAARNGAYYGSTSTAAAVDETGIRTAALADTTSLSTASGAVSVQSGTFADSQGYTVLSVTVAYPFRLVAGLPNFVRTVPLSRTVQMRVAGSL